MSNILHSQPPSGGIDPAPRPDVLAHVAANVRRLRLAAGLSQEKLAEASGLSRRMIVAIESGEANISLANLDRLAAALAVSFSEVVRDPAAPDGARIDRLLWRGAAPGSEAVLLGTAPSARETEMWVWALGAGERYDAEADAGGWSEMVYVLTGTLRVERADGVREVAAGDFLIFSSPSPYTFVNPGAAPMRFLRCVAV